MFLKVDDHQILQVVGPKCIVLIAGNSRPANTEKIYFLRHGGVIEGTHARSITNRIRNNVWVDATATFDIEGHFKGHKAQNGYLSSYTIFYWY